MNTESMLTNHGAHVRLPLTTILFLIVFPIVFLTWLLVFLFVDVLHVQAAGVECTARYKAGIGDTWQTLQDLYKVPAYDMQIANKRLGLTGSPNWPLYVGVKYCIPKPSEHARAVPPWIMSQPAATYYATQEGRILTVYLYTFQQGSLWLVKPNNIKHDNWQVKVVKKVKAIKTFKLASDEWAETVCFKNRVTDLKLCKGTLHIEER